MKNAINYYYDIYVNDIVKTEKDYYFYHNNEEYHFVIFNRPLDDIKPLYELNVEMLNYNVLSHKIILNKNNEILTTLNDVHYMLIKNCNYKNKFVFINDLVYLQKKTAYIKYNDELLRNNWVKMWSDKIDYYEYQISQFGKKYPILCDSLSYYIGMGENAISYLKNNYKMENDFDKNSLVVSHKRINVVEGSFEFYNPLNYIIDSRVRDVSEYIKNRFFYQNLNFYEIRTYMDYASFDKNEYIMLFSRLLFPTYYFDVYDDIINNNLKEEKIISIINKNELYEQFLVIVYNYIVKEKNIFIEPIEWLIK